MGGGKPASFQFKDKGKEKGSTGVLNEALSERGESVRDQKRKGVITLSSPNTRRAVVVAWSWILFGFAL